MSRSYIVVVMLLLFAVSLAPQVLAQGAASGESIAAFERGQAPATPAIRVPGLSSGRVSYWELAGLGRDALGMGSLPPALLPWGMPHNPFSAFGPYGIFDQYGIYGPYGMYGASGPGYGSGLGFEGFARNDPWLLVKLYNEANTARAAANVAMTAAPKAGSNVTITTNQTGPPYR